MSARTVLKRRSESSKQPRPSSAARKPFRPRLEPLETRLTPNCTVPFSNRIDCDDGNDNVEVRISGIYREPLPWGPLAEYWNNGVRIYNYYVRSDTMTVNLGGGANSLTVNDTALTSPLTYTVSNTPSPRIVIGAAGYLNVLHTGPAQFLRLWASQGNDIINVNSTSGPTIVDGAPGNDTIAVSSTIGNLAGSLSSPLTVHGGPGTDSLSIWDNLASHSGTYNVSHLATTVTGAPAINYSFIESLGLGAAAGNNVINVDFTLSGGPTGVNAGGGNDTVNVAASTGYLDNLGGPFSVTGGTGTDALRLYDGLNSHSGAYTVTSSSVAVTGAFVPTTTYGSFESLELQAATGNNAIYVDSTLFGGPTIVTAGGGTDRVYVTSNSRTLGSLGGALTVNGGPGTDYIALYDDQAGHSNPYTIGNVVVQRTGAFSTDYGAFEELYLYAAPGDNTITINSTHGGQTYVDTGFGGDTVNVQSTQGPLTIEGWAGQDSVWVNANVGGIQAAVNVRNSHAGGSTALTVDVAAYTPAYTATLSATAISFGGVPINYGQAQLRSLTLRGGSGNNAYWVMSTPQTSYPDGVRTTINGGVGNDTITVRFNRADSTLTLDAGGGNDTIQIGENNLVGILGSIVVGGGTGTNTLNVNDRTGSAGKTFTIAAGSVSVNAAPLTVSHADVQALNVTGGAGDDTFAFADGGSVSGTVNGGGGANALDYSAYPANVYVNLRTGAATGVAGGLSNIHYVLGGPGNDILVGAAGNVLAGGPGRDVLIGGAAPSVLFGDFFEDLGEDILIAGSTIYDTNAAALQAIRDHWAGGATYETRVANLRNGAGVPRLDATTVTYNGGPNLLLGGGGRDFGFCRPAVDIFIDPEEGETVVPI